MRAASLISLGAFALLTPSFRAAAQSTPSTVGNACVAHVAEAASRSGLSSDLLYRVVRAESGGNPRIVSSKGAMGCMQIMPVTWTYLTARYNLGTDPFDPRRNMIGGAMYLAELTASYGFGGAVAAYNAGPGRYERYITGSKALPAETVAYVQRIGASEGRRAAEVGPARWQEAGLFLSRDAASPLTSSVKGDVPSPERPVIADRLVPLRQVADAQALPDAGP